MNDCESLVLNTFMNEVMNDVNVLSLLMVPVVLGKVNSTSIINKYSGRQSFKFSKTKFNQEMT